MIILGSLSEDMLGYHHFEKMSWIDAYEHATMILSGMSSVATVKIKGRKILVNPFTLFIGIVFLLVITIIFVPIVHRFFHKFHIQEEKLGE
ncbi:MAG: hypothetical protein WCE84_03905 [Candidatus Rhabdochlamydia sp.]